MALIQTGVAYTRTFKLIDSTDHVSKKTGATATVNIAKAGGAFAAAGGTVTELSQGWYKIALTTTDTNTLGDLTYYITASGADDTDFTDQVVAFNPGDAVRLGLTALPNAAAEAAGGLYTRGTGAGQVNQDANGRLDANVKTWIGGTIPAVNVTGVPKVDLVDVAGAAVSTTSAQLGVNAVQVGATAQTGRDLGASVLLSNGTGTGQVSLASGAVTAGSLGATAKTDVENSVWDATRASHVAVGSFGLGLGIVIRDNTAAAGAAATITLDASAPTTADIFKGCVIYLYSGTGAGQAPRLITAYSTGRVATVSPAWTTQPDSSSKFLIFAHVTAPLVGSDARALVSADSHTAGETVAAVTGAVGSVTAAVAVSDKTGFALTSGEHTNVTNDVWDAARSGHVGAGSFGQGVASVQGSVTGSVASVTAAVTTTLAIKKNTSFSAFSFPLFDATDHVTPKTGLTVTGTRSLGGAAFASLANSVSEIGTTGVYKVDLAAADLNSDEVVLRFTATGADPQLFQIITQS